MPFPPADVVACGARPDVFLCEECIDAYRNGIEPLETACDDRFDGAYDPPYLGADAWAVALLSAQGTACGETVLRDHDDTRARRAAIEAAIVPGPDAPIPGTWTDVTNNDAI